MPDPESDLPGLIQCAWQVAAFDAVNKMRAIAKVTQTGIYHPLGE